MSNNKTIGARGEDIAADYLGNNGYSILKRNYHTRIGELDIIARKDNTICFIEVKTRQSLKCGFPAESVTHIKQQHIRRTAELFLMKEARLISNFQQTSFRFDVCNVILERNEKDAESVEYIENAF